MDDHPDYEIGESENQEVLLKKCGMSVDKDKEDGDHIDEDQDGNSSEPQKVILLVDIAQGGSLS